MGNCILTEQEAAAILPIVRAKMEEWRKDQDADTTVEVAKTMVEPVLRRLEEAAKKTL